MSPKGKRLQLRPLEAGLIPHLEKGESSLCTPNAAEFWSGACAKRGSVTDADEPQLCDSCRWAAAL